MCVILKIICLLFAKLDLLLTDSFSFTFPRIVVNVQVCLLFHNLAALGQFSVCVHEPSANACTCHSHGHTQGTDHKVCVWGEGQVMWMRCREH